MNLNREVLRLAIPAIIANITVPLLSLVDTTVAGHLHTTADLAAIAAGAMMINIIPWLCGFLRMGTTGLAANAFGTGNRNLCLSVIYKAVGIAAVLSVCVVALRQPLFRLLAELMNTEKSVEKLASDYFRICILGMPGQLIMMAVTGWFIGLQNTTVPMLIAVGINVVNIFLDIYLALSKGMGVAGIATGTAIANWLGALLSLAVAVWWIVKKRGPLPPAGHRSETKMKESVAWSDFFNINGGLFVRSACVMTVSLSMTAFGARMGNEILAANAVMMQFFIFYSYFMDGFAFAGEALAGRYQGAGNITMVDESVKGILKWGAGMAAGFLMIYIFFGMDIAGMITDKEEILAKVWEMRIWIYLLPVLTVLAFVFDGIFIGLTRIGPMLRGTLIATAVFFAITYFGGTTIENFTLIWVAFETYLLIRGIYLAISWLRNNTKEVRT